MSADSSGGLHIHVHADDQLGLIRHRESNARLPIHKLPPEVLFHVFKSFSVIEWRGGDVPWIKITHVCHAWREIALSSPTLWNRIRIISSTSVERVVIWLQRSQQAPLTVTALPVLQYHEGPIRLEIYRSIFRQFSRIRELEVALPQDQFFSLEWPDAPAGQLKYLSIKDSLTIGDPSVRSWTLPSRIADRFPALTSLSAFRVPFSLLILPSTLTNLQIWDSTPNQQTTVEQVLDLLRGLPLLEKLDLARGLLGNSVAVLPQAENRTVNLPHLCFLSLTEHLVPLAELLKHLTVPEWVQLKLTLLLNSESISHLPAISLFVTSWVNRLRRPWHTVSYTFPTYTAEDVDGSQMIFSAMQDLSSERVWRHWVSDAALLVKLEDDNDRPTEAFWALKRMDSFFSGFNMAEVENLCLHIKDEVLHPHLPTVWSKLGNVQMIHIHGSDYSVTTACFCLFDVTHTNSFLFPKLRTLYLDGFDGQPNSIAKLRQWFVARGERGSPLEKIIVREGMGHTRDDFGVLQDLVVVEWISDRELWRDRTLPSIDQQAVMAGIAQLIDELENEPEFESEIEDTEDQ